MILAQPSKILKKNSELSKELTKFANEKEIEWEAENANKKSTAGTLNGQI